MMSKPDDGKNERLLKAVRSGSPTEMYKAFYPQLSTLESQLRGEIPDEKVAEVAHFQGNKLISLTEITKAPPYLSKTAFYRGLKRNPRKELLGTIKGKSFETLRLYCYHHKPLNEISCFRESSKRGLLVASGGVHSILFSLDFREAIKLRNMLDRLIYRLKRQENPEKNQEFNNYRHKMWEPEVESRQRSPGPAGFYD